MPELLECLWISQSGWSSMSKGQSSKKKNEVEVGVQGGEVGRERRRGGVDHVGLLRWLKICSFFFDEIGGNNSSLLYSRR